jgi:DNA polymerase-4
MDRNIIHVHIPAFPIAVARVVRPELRGRPVVVAPPHSERALLLSVSAEARQEGIFKGMPLGKAMKFCPGLTVLPPDHDLTAKACRVLAGVVARYTPLWEPSLPGHIYLDVTGTDRLWGRAKDTANRLRQEIKEQVQLSGTVGVASNKLVSSIASRLIRSEGVLDVGHGREPSFMAPLKVNVLPGIGPVRRRILLEELNITLVRQIVALDMGNLKLVFGQQAYVIHQRALGIDPTPVFPPSTEPTVSEEVSLPQDENDDKKLLGVLYELVEKCSYQLRNRSLLPRKAGIYFRYTDQEEVTRHVRTPKPSFWEFDLYAPLEAAFLKACRRRVRVRFMKIWFKDFSAPSAQLSLFAFAPQGEKKKAQVISALDRIREKHGEAFIQYGRTAGSHHRGTEGTEKSFCLSRSVTGTNKNILP